MCVEQPLCLRSCGSSLRVQQPKTMSPVCKDDTSTRSSIAHNSGEFRDIAHPKHVSVRLADGRQVGFHAVVTVVALQYARRCLLPVFVLCMRCRNKCSSSHAREGQSLEVRKEATRKERSAHMDARRFRAGIRKDRPCLMQNVAPTPLGTPHFLILRSGHPRLNRVRGSPFRDPEIEAGFCHVKFFS